MFWQSVKFPET